MKLLPVTQDPPGWTPGRIEAVQTYTDLGICERCGNNPACDRHHKDGNTSNNARSNVQFVCRRCHMELDGRMEAFVAAGENARQPQPAKNCANCGRSYKPLRRGRCAACDMYLRRHGVER